MKKLIALFLCVCLTLGIFACGNVSTEETPECFLSESKTSVLANTETWARSRVRYDSNFDWDAEEIPSNYYAYSASLFRFTDQKSYDTWINEVLLTYENPADYPFIYLSDKNAAEIVKRYNYAEFFEENALFLISFDAGSGSCRYSDLNVTADENDALTVSLTITYPNPYTDDMARQIFFVPISKEYADAENVSLVAEIVYLTMEESWDIFKE